MFKFSVLLLLVASACSALAADLDKQNLGKIREEILVLESVLNQNLTQTFPGPFGYLDKARGAYLPGYGVVFTFEVNLFPRPANLGPFGPAVTKPVDDKVRRAEIEKRRAMARDMSERVLADFGHTLDQLAPDESVAVVMHGSSVSEQGVEKSTTVLRAQKRDIDQFRANTIDRAAFLRRVQVLEY